MLLSWNDGTFSSLNLQKVERERLEDTEGCLVIWRRNTEKIEEVEEQGDKKNEETEKNDRKQEEKQEKKAEDKVKEQN